MKRLGLLLLTLAFPATAFAGDGTCKDTYDNCTTKQTCTASPCVVTISHAPGGPATVSVNNYATDRVCTNGNTLKWQTVDTNPSFAGVLFVGGRSPYTPQNDLVFDSYNPVTPAYAHHAGDCYVFNVTDCLLGGSDCGSADPKVVMPPPAYNHPRKNKKKTGQSPQ
jgi:hypothetical protein